MERKRGGTQSGAEEDADVWAGVELRAVKSEQSCGGGGGGGGAAAAACVERWTDAAPCEDRCRRAPWISTVYCADVKDQQVLQGPKERERNTKRILGRSYDERNTTERPDS